MRRLSFAFLAFLVLSAGSAQASVSYQYVTDQSSYSANAGASVTVYFFLQENLTGGSSSIINNDKSGSFAGLYGAAFVASVNSGTNGNAAFVTGSLAFNTNSSTAALPGFGNGNSSNLPNTATSQGGAVNINTAPAGPLTSNISSIGGVSLASTITNAIYLGSATITAGSAGSTTTFTLSSYHAFNGKNGNTITSNSGFDLDVTNNANNGGGATYTGANNNPFTFTVNVSAAPEPSSFLLCGFAACSLGYGAYRRRKAKDQEPVQPETTTPTVA